MVNNINNIIMKFLFFCKFHFLPAIILAQTCCLKALKIIPKLRSSNFLFKSNQCNHSKNTLGLNCCSFQCIRGFILMSIILLINYSLIFIRSLLNYFFYCKLYLFISLCIDLRPLLKQELPITNFTELSKHYLVLEGSRVKN